MPDSTPIKNSPEKIFSKAEFRASWFDRFSAWIEQLPLPYWLCYLIISLLLLGLGYLLQAADGIWSLSGWDPIIFVVIFQISFAFSIVHYLNQQAIRALDDFLPAIKTGLVGHLPRYQRAFSTMPAGRLLAACLLFMSVGLLLVINVMRGADIGTTIDVSFGYFGSFFALMMLLLWFTNGLVYYHTFHQLQFVDFAYKTLAEVHPFHQQELFAFSGFSARTGICLMLLTPLWIIFDPGPLSLGICIVFGLFALTAFISPLIGVHRILSREKERLLNEHGWQVEGIIARMRDKLARKEGEVDLKQIEVSLSSLALARTQIERISTWPWKAETVRQLLAAIVLPTLIWVIQYLLSTYVFG